MLDGVVAPPASQAVVVVSTVVTEAVVQVEAEVEAVGFGGVDSWSLMSVAPYRQRLFGGDGAKEDAALASGWVSIFFYWFRRSHKLLLPDHRTKYHIP